ncbi:DUF927 domain-containing protein [Mesorhizobium sp. M2E.F.Ca.ET.209.01.1.1]|uniref:DUF927 domain-containing protein n=1 Tax=Mesorhizobium sp. M2E.F.Ca.ET.209.01.1.1 TaxID=2500526 RepID=UPI000FD7C33E|nr:DUF927 domain-containing protein [Mesorhizobium sp. M2E.F.Ca.ET.209.01.1.1]TGS19031.1 DUF927 domain-containing protein [Mesorhizobium sp. M2E.F.Ca.ET.209.01.1.1]
MGKEMSSGREMPGSEQLANGPCVLDKVRDQEGRIHFKYGTDKAAIWFSAADLVRDDKAVFADLVDAGFAFLSSKPRTALLTALDQHSSVRDALVAIRPGWLSDDIYVFGDGAVVREDGLDSEILIAFKHDARFTPVGEIKAWKAGISRIVGGEALAAFLLSYAFVGPLLRFAPSYLTNPFVELVGPPECGKTTFAIMAAGAYAGNPNSNVGGGETWNMTEQAFDDVRKHFQDSMLFVDEQNEMDLALRTSGKMAFKQSSSSGRRRLGQPPEQGIKVALLSTANEASKDAMQGKADVVAAAGSRTCTIAFKGPIMTVCPEGFSNPEKAMYGLRKFCDVQYGTAGRKFVQAVAKQVKESGAKALGDRIELLMSDFRSQVSSKEAPARVVNAFALTYAAGRLARAWGVLPAFEQTIAKAVRTIFDLASPATASESKDIEWALERTQSVLQKYATRTRDLNEGKAAHIFWEPPFAYRKSVHKVVTYYVPTENLQQALGSDCQRVLQRLRADGKLKSEGGNKPKLSIKAPTFVPVGGQRVYCITL